MGRVFFTRMWTASVSGTLLWASGCALPGAIPDPVTTAPRTLIGKPNPSDPTVLGRSVEDRPIECMIFGTGNDSILIIATIHGNEAAGTPLVHRLGEYLGTHPELLRGRRVILVPNLNPDGHEHNSRYNANRVDLNRNFPSDNRRNTKRFGMSALSEPESRAIYDAIERFQPVRIVTIHQPAACIDYDGPAADLAAIMAEAGSLKIKKIGAKPGSLGSYAGNTLGIPTITLELPRRASRLDEDELWARYGRMLLVAIESG